jgi:hypothetical protein
MMGEAHRGAKPKLRNFRQLPTRERIREPRRSAKRALYASLARF